MDEYIERLTVVSAIKKYEIENCPEYMRDWVTKLKEATLDDITDIVLETPAADVAPVVQGRWIEDGFDCICSECGSKDGAINTRYCPSCGAKMDGGGEHAAPRGA